MIIVLFDNERRKESGNISRFTNSVNFSGFTANAFATDGTINFTGVITATPCTIDLGGSSTLDVNIGTFGINSFKNASGNTAAGVTAGSRQFNYFC